VTKLIQPPKKTLNDLLYSKEVITGKEVIHKLKELEQQQQQQQQQQFAESSEFEQRNRSSQ
jgi:hypothetical protein